jgi:hypothetical protein
MNEELIIGITYKHLEEDAAIERACLGRNYLFDPERYENYTLCIYNEVEVTYNKLIIAADIFGR